MALMIFMQKLVLVSLSSIIQLYFAFKKKKKKNLSPVLGSNASPVTCWICRFCLCRREGCREAAARNVGWCVYKTTLDHLKHGLLARTGGSMGGELAWLWACFSTRGGSALFCAPETARNQSTS